MDICIFEHLKIVIYVGQNCGYDICLVSSSELVGYLDTTVFHI